MRPFFDLNESDELVSVGPDGCDVATSPADLIAELTAALPWSTSGKLPSETPVMPDGKECRRDFSRDERFAFIARFGVAAWQDVPNERPEALTRTQYMLQSPNARDFARSFAAEKKELQERWENRLRG